MIIHTYLTDNPGDYIKNKNKIKTALKENGYEQGIKKG